MKMQDFVDELAAAGELIMAHGHVSYILAGLACGYDSLVAALGSGYHSNLSEFSLCSDSGL
jgi:hypothetical protein